MAQIGSFILFFWITWTLSLSDQIQMHLIGASQPIEVLVGEDVILPCHLTPAQDLVLLTVEWSRTDIKPDPYDRLVHVYTDGQEELDMKLSEFVNRTQLLQEELKVGNASLRIQRVRPLDTGTYRCFIPVLEVETFVSLIVLSAETVTPDSTPEPKLNDSRPDSLSKRSFLSIGLSFAALLITALGLMVFVFVKLRAAKLQERNKARSPIPGPSEMESGAGDSSRVKSVEKDNLLQSKSPTDDRTTLQAG